MPFEKTTTLREAFRTILRDRYPQRPALADEIQSEAWFMYPTFQRPTPPEEVEAAKSARVALVDAIRKRRVRLQGFLDQAVPADIHPVIAARSLIKIFDGTLIDHGMNGRTYRNVECSEEDVRALLAPMSSALPAIMTREQAVRACLNEGMIPGKTGTTTWKAFCMRVRDLADGWIDKHEGTTKNGFTEKTIKRDVEEITTAQMS